jgi:hypothetical protein
VNGNNTQEDPSPQASPRTDGSADKDLPKPEGKPAEPAKPKSAQPQPGEHAAQDARKALEDTVENLRVSSLVACSIADMLLIALPALLAVLCILLAMHAREVVVGYPL